MLSPFPWVPLGWPSIQRGGGQPCSPLLQGGKGGSIFPLQADPLKPLERDCHHSQGELSEQTTPCKALPTLQDGSEVILFPMAKPLVPFCIYHISYVIPPLVNHLSVEQPRP